MDDYVTEYYNSYKTKCMEKVSESFNYTYVLKEYHYTLYYYDQAKNLTQTVPPEGVKPLTTAQVQAFLAGKGSDPGHTLVTQYKYSSLKFTPSTNSKGQNPL